MCFLEILRRLFLFVFLAANQDVVNDDDAGNIN